MNAQQPPQLVELVHHEVARQRRLLVTSLPHTHLLPLLAAQGHAAIALQQHADVVATVAHRHHHTPARLLHVRHDVRLRLSRARQPHLLLGRDAAADHRLAANRVLEEVGCGRGAQQRRVHAERQRVAGDHHGELRWV